MAEQKYIELITARYGPRAAAVFEAVNEAIEEYHWNAKSTKLINACVKRMHAGDPGALKELADWMYGMSGSARFKF